VARPKWLSLGTASDVLGVGQWCWDKISPLVLPGIMAVVIGFLASGVHWVNQFGHFGWAVAALGAFFVSSAALALLAKAKMWRTMAKDRTRLSSDSSPFDPMDDIFQNKRIKITDLVNPYDQVVMNKKFINCELIGPANIFIVFTNAKFANNNFDKSDAVEIRDNALPMNAIAFGNCDFEKCRFFKVTMLFQTSSRKFADTIISNMNWLTQIEEPLLALENKAEARRGFKGFLRRATGADAAP
jgi:hypothetical protein